MLLSTSRLISELSLQEQTKEGNSVVQLGSQLDVGAGSLSSTSDSPLAGRQCQQAHQHEDQPGLIYTGRAEVVKKREEGMKLRC